MFKTKKTKNILFSLLVVFMTLVVFLGLEGTLAAKLSLKTSAKSKASPSITTGVHIDNSTLDYPIEYQLGSVARNISITTYCRIPQYVRVKIEMRYVTINTQTGACTVTGLNTNNVNIVPFMGEDWYLYDDGEELWAYLCEQFTADENLGKSTSTLLTGVEFFDVDDGISYDDKKLQFIFTAYTSLTAFADAPAVWTNRINSNDNIYNSSGATGYGSATIYNSRTADNQIAFGNTNDNYSGIGFHRTPTYVKNDSGCYVGLTFKIEIKWHGTNANDLPLNRVKVNLSGNNFTAYNKDAQTTNTSLYEIAGTTGTEADQLQYTAGTYFYKVKLAPYQIVSLIDSIEIINFFWTGIDDTMYANHYLTVEVKDAKTFAIGTPDSDVSTATAEVIPSTNWASNLQDAKTQFDIVQPYVIEIDDNMGTISVPSTIISHTDNMTISVEYNVYVAMWVQFTSQEEIKDEEYDIVAGEYYLKDISDNVTIGTGANWNSNYQYGGSTAVLSQNRAVSLYNRVDINEVGLASGAYSDIESGYTDSFGNSGIPIPTTYTVPNYLLVVEPIVTTATSGGNTTTDYASEALVSHKKVTFNTSNNGVNAYGIAVKNTTNFVYASATLSLAITGTISHYGLNDGWTMNGTILTYSGAIQPGQTIVAVGSIKGSGTVTIAAYATLNESSNPTSQTLDIVNETQSKGIFNQANTSNGINYNGIQDSHTKKIRITNTSTDTLYVQVHFSYTFIKAGTTISSTVTLNDSNWSSQSNVYYYNGFLLPGASITLGGGYTISATTALAGSTLIFNTAINTSAVDATATQFSAPSGWTYSTWISTMTTMYKNYYNYTYTYSA